MLVLDKKNRKEFSFVDLVYSSPTAGFFTLSRNADDTKLEFPVAAGRGRILCAAFPKKFSFSDFQQEYPEGFVLEKIIHRDDYFDYLHLTEQYPISQLLEDSDYQKTLSTITPNVTFFVTYRCTFKCPFCWQRHDAGKYSTVSPKVFDPDVLATTFNRLKPGSIYFTGGEPTLYKGLYSLISKLDSSIKVTMTSNLGPSFNVDEFIRCVRPEQCLPMGFSFHPSETTDEQYLTNLVRLHDANYPLYVESVLYGPDIPRLVKMKDKLVEYGIDCRYDRCTLPDGKMHVLTDEQEEMVRYLQGAPADDASKPAMAPLRNIMEEKQGTILCPAGHKNFHIDPLGDVYCCMSALDRSRLFSPYALPHYAPIGNIMDPDFNYLEQPIYCWEAFRCSACDFMRLQTGWKFLSEERPFLPE